MRCVTAINFMLSSRYANGFDPSNTNTSRFYGDKCGLAMTAGYQNTCENSPPFVTACTVLVPLRRTGPAMDIGAYELLQLPAI